MTCLISLGFDRVLHPAQDSLDHALHLLWLDVLVRLPMQHPDVRLTIHSTWRYTHAPDELRQLPTSLDARVLGAAPRGPLEESIFWLLRILGDVNSYLVLDDAPKEFTKLEPPTLLLWDPELGSSSPKVQARIQDWLDKGLDSAPSHEAAP